MNKVFNLISQIQSYRLRNNFFFNSIKEEFLLFDEKLSNSTGHKIQKHYSYRFHEILTISNRYQIKSILEIGSGRTTFLFLKLVGDNLISVEQNKNFLDSIINSIDYNLNIQLSEVIPYKNGAKLKTINNINQTPDLLYIDGPFINLPNQKTFTHKPAYYCFEDVLEKKLPKLIMIDGRTDTVDLILNSKFSKKYHFKPGFQWSYERGKLSLMKFNYHSVFVLRND